MKRVLIAMDKYKGSVTATQAGEAVARGLRRAGIEVQCDICPIADGGEGTTEALVTALGGQWVDAQVSDALGRPMVARYGWMQDKREAVMEMSVASGLAIVSDAPLQPGLASTRGTGEMLLDALRRGARRIIIGIGGSATNDGGLGMAAALGFRFLDKRGHAVQRLPEDWAQVHSISHPLCPDAQAECEVLVACDVDNPLLGERGATRVYGPQKGVVDIAYFEHRLTRLADLVARDLGCDHRAVPGAGAAGGLGFGLMSFCSGRLVGGFDLVAEVTGLAQRMQGASLVITGEGRVDAQTLFGKGPAGVAAMAQAKGVPCVAVAGMVEDSAALRGLFAATFAAKPDAMPLAEAISRGAALIEETVERHAQRFREWLHL
jgi:glycerate kinase